jgi:hypothetical protein
METGGILGLTALVVSVVGTIVAAINHKKVVSKCCGKKVEMSLDITQTAPSPTIMPIVPVAATAPPVPPTIEAPPKPEIP